MGRKALIQLFEDITSDASLRTVDIYFGDLTAEGRDKILKCIQNASDSQSVDLDMDDPMIKDSVVKALFNVDNPVAIATVNGAELKSSIDF